MKVRVELLDRYKQLGKGELAGFPQEEAEDLIARGIARRVPQQMQPLVSAALSIPDEQVQRLAHALARLGNLGDREAQQARLRADVAAVEKQEARALALGEALPADVAEQKRLLVERLLRVEKEIQILTDQHEPLLRDLQQAVQAYITRTWQAVLTARVGPALREIAALVRKAEGSFDNLAAGAKALEDLRAVAQVAEMDGGTLETLLAETVREIAGADVLTSPITGRTSLDNLAFVLYGLATAQQQAKVGP